MAARYSIVRAGVESAERVVEQRRAMFVDMGYGDGAVLDRMAAEFRPWVIASMMAGRYLAWFAMAPDGAILGGAGLWVMDWLPHVIVPGALRGNIVNVYTEREFRRQGIARSLVNAALDWCRRNGIRCVILHASDDGRDLYEALGFRATNEMRTLL